jgi:hypothetical protein
MLTWLTWFLLLKGLRRPSRSSRLFREAVPSIVYGDGPVIPAGRLGPPAP